MTDPSASNWRPTFGPPCGNVAKSVSKGCEQPATTGTSSGSTTSILLRQNRAAGCVAEHRGDTHQFDFGAVEGDDERQSVVDVVADVGVQKVTWFYRGEIALGALYTQGSKGLGKDIDPSEESWPREFFRRRTGLAL
jgi:hypothetical protein